MPYNPGVEDRSGELLARGISRGGQSLAAGLESYLTKRKEKAQKATSLRKALSVYQPDKKDEFQAMGLEELEGAVAGLKMQEEARTAQGKQQEDAARLDYYKEQRGLVNQRALREQAEAIALARFKELNGGELAEGVQGPPRPPVMEAQRMVANAGRAGLGPEEIGRLARGLSDMQAMGGGEQGMEFIEDPLTGVRFGKLGRQVMPSGVNPLKAAGETFQLLDEEGNPTGKFGLRTPKGVQVFSGANEERGMRDSAATIAQLEGVLTELDRQLQGYESRNAGIAAKQKGFENLKPVGAEQLEELRKRRQRVARQLEALDGGGEPRNTQNTRKEGVEQKEAKGTKAGGAKVDTGAAESIRSEYRAGKISKEEAVKRLKEIGYGD